MGGTPQRRASSFYKETSLLRSNTSARHRRVAFAVTLAGTLLAVVPLAAHDFWIQPSTFTPLANTVVQIHLRVGDDFPGEPVSRNDMKIATFFVHGPDGRWPVPGRNGGRPAGLLRITAAGTYLIGYRSRESPVTLAAPAFEQYLREEGLERIIELRAQRNQSSAPGRERFSRSVKSLLHAGGAPPAGHDVPLGLSLELIPDTHPSRLSASTPMGLQLLYQGQPIEGALVVAIPHGAAEGSGVQRRQGRTAADGRVELPLGPGAWTIKAVHMIDAPEGSGADWESIWTSLTFEVTAAGQTRAK